MNMKPSWIYSPKTDAFELRGCWKKLCQEAGAKDSDWSTKKLQVLILRQLCKITGWLVVIAVAQVFLTCDIAFFS
jgi:hypothetical protein